MFFLLFLKYFARNLPDEKSLRHIISACYITFKILAIFKEIVTRYYTLRNGQKKTPHSRRSFLDMKKIGD